MPGPSPQNPELRLIRGSRTPKAPAIGTPAGVAALSTAVPDELIANPAAADEWDRVIVPAIESGIVTAADRAMAIAHCDLWAVWRSQLAEAATAPHVLHVGPNAHPTPNPIRGMCNTTGKMLRAVDLALGLTPTTRGRVVPQRPAKPTTTKVERFMARKKKGSR